MSKSCQNWSPVKVLLHSGTPVKVLSQCPSSQVRFFRKSEFYVKEISFIIKERRLRSLAFFIRVFNDLGASGSNKILTENLFWQESDNRSILTGKWQVRQVLTRFLQRIYYDRKVTGAPEHTYLYFYRHRLLSSSCVTEATLTLLVTKLRDNEGSCDNSENHTQGCHFFMGMFISYFFQFSRRR